MEAIREKPQDRMLRKTITLILTEDCNLRCSYCYEGNRSPHPMSLDTAKEIIEREFLAEDKFTDMEIDFFGGEALLEFATMKACCEYIWSRPWPKKHICYVCTNGTLVHGQIKDWLRENKERIWCGLSMDGTREMHNINRCNSFDQIDFAFSGSAGRSSR